MARISALQLLNNPEIEVTAKLLEQAADELNGRGSHTYTAPPRRRSSGKANLVRINRIRRKRGLLPLTRIPGKDGLVSQLNEMASELVWFESLADQEIMDDLLNNAKRATDSLRDLRQKYQRLA